MREKNSFLNVFVINETICRFVIEVINQFRFFLDLDADQTSLRTRQSNWRTKYK